MVAFPETGGGKEESEGVGRGGVEREWGRERDRERDRETETERWRKETVWIYTSCQIDMVTSEKQTDRQTD